MISPEIIHDILCANESNDVTGKPKNIKQYRHRLRYYQF